MKPALNKILSFGNAPDAVILAVIAVAAVLVFVLFYVVIFLISDYTTTKKTEHKAPDSHRMLVDLQKAILDEMRGTAKQNSLMIFLTILFISVSVIGIVVSVLGPAKSMVLFRQIISSVRAMTLNVFGDLGRALGR